MPANDDRDIEPPVEDDSEDSAAVDDSTAIVGKHADERSERRGRPAARRKKRKTFTLTQLLIAVGGTLALAGIAIAAIIANYEGQLDQAAGTSGAAVSTDDIEAQPAIDLARNQPGDPLAVGEDDAPVVLIEYSDYRCPYCALWARDVKPELMPYVENGTLRIEHHDLPIFGQESVMAAIAGRAAANQGMFWEYYDALHAVAPTQGHPSLPKEVLLQYAEQIGIPDLAKFETDMSDPELQQAVMDEAQKAIELGASSTPLFLINGEPIVGAQPLDVFIEKIEQHADNE